VQAKYAVAEMSRTVSNQELSDITPAYEITEITQKNLMNDSAG
jgi:hypothetical protein